MDEDKGLDLSLGLPFGASSSKSKDGERESIGSKADGGDRTSKILSDFRNFLSGGNPRQESGEFNRVDTVKQQENYFSNINQASAEADAARNGSERRVWATCGIRPVGLEDEKAPAVGDKRKVPLDEPVAQKKQEIEPHDSDIHEKTKSSNLSRTTDGGSVADNEDVADSEADASTSRLASLPGDGSKRLVRSGNSSELSKELNGKLITPASSLLLRSVGTMNEPYPMATKESASSGVLGLPGYPATGKRQAMPPVTIERTGSQNLSGGNVPLIFGYSPAQLPTYDKDDAWMAALSQSPFHPSYSVRGLSPSAGIQGSPNLPGAIRPSQIANGEENQTKEEGSSLQTDDDARGASLQSRGKAAPEVPTTNGFPSDYPAIRSGIAADIKFEGSGSSPNLPWVSTTGPGPNGKTISGVTYKINASRVRIVCACHGSHMSPEEFIQHAAEEQPAATDNGAASPLPSPSACRSRNPATSARG